MHVIIELTIIVSISMLALLLAGISALRIRRADPGSRRMVEISDLIHDSALRFLHKEYVVIIMFLLAISGLIIVFLEDGKMLAISFAVGGCLSAIAGNIGLRIATIANTRTAQAAKVSAKDGMRIAFASGAVMGLCVVGLGLLGIASIYAVFREPLILYGFGFGASAIALFARVGGGIFTKAADMGADLVGKVEEGIPEDDPHNPAVIADNVGDNVGDVAGMGADLFESYVDSIIAAMVIGMGIMAFDGVMLPMLLAGAGIISSAIGFLFVRARRDEDLSKALDRGTYASCCLMVLASAGIIRYITGDYNLFWPVLAGIAAGVTIGASTEHYTSGRSRPTQLIARSSTMGVATNITKGIAIGMQSTLIPVIAVCAAIFVSYMTGSVYGIAIAAVGMLSTLGITLAADCYGPVADNAAGISQMAHMKPEVRRRTESLDELGNTTAAIGKGFAIGSAALTSLALFSSYIQITGLSGINLVSPNVIIGLFIGALLPFMFSSMTIDAVSTAAYEVVEEVRRQFRSLKGLKEGKRKPDYEGCISISTNAALKGMIMPTLMAVTTPIIIGLALGPEAVGGLIAGSIATGFLLAIFMANSGGAWDNAKKYIEAGHFGGKGSKPHKASIVGDTVGDPFKDTSGPSLNILIKLITIVALVFLPLFL